MASDLYFCPSSREVESAIGGGFDVCCARPDLHLPMPVGPATEAVSMALSEAAKRDMEHERVTGELMRSWSREVTPLHGQLGRIRLNAWSPEIDDSDYRELVQAVVGHPLMSRADADAAVASIRAECRRVGIPVADTAEEKIARIRALHRPDMSGRCCEGCWDYDGNPQEWPCPTNRALDEETPA